MKKAKSSHQDVQAQLLAGDSLTDSQIIVGSSIRIEPIFHTRFFHFNDRVIFVLMPFSEPWSDRIWEKLKEIVRKKGLVPERADNMQGAIITEDIWTGIMEARIIICDTTGWNPNVFYELGIAHTLGKPVILITQPSQKSPFDTQGLRHVEYTDNPAGMEKLEGELPKHLGYYLSKLPTIRPGYLKRIRQEKTPRKTDQERFQVRREFREQAKTRWSERAKGYEPELPPLGYPRLRADMGNQRAYLKRIGFALQDQDFEQLLVETKKV